MMKTGHVEKTSDRSYEVEERRYRTLESASLRLQKEAKGYLDSLRAMTASQMRIAETIDAFYGDSGAKDGVSRSYKQAVEDLDAETVKALDGPYRCVPDSLYKSAGEDVDLPCQIEKEWKFQAGNTRHFTRHMMDGYEEQCELMEFVYRTTVLEPINRFCAYFPDINECMHRQIVLIGGADIHIGIKKRQHKMLDYDALRAKVKKLTEKPDKDPGKLPRTEKETEMVGLQSPSVDPFNACRKDDEMDLAVPSPPKALQRPEIERLKSQQAQIPPRHSSLQLNRSPSMMSQASRACLYSSSVASSGAQLQRSSSVATQVSAYSANAYGLCRGTHGTPTRTTSHLRSVSMPTHSPPLASHAIAPAGTSVSMDISPTKLKPRSMASTRPGHSRTGSRGRIPTPFLQPSELEEMMEPFKQEFVQKQADIYVQAKAAYEQLNEQLTSELPQLIDLR
jgi:hypothetical protein